MGAPLFWRLWHSMQAMLSSFLAFAKLGTRKGLLRYRICVPCSKRLPTVRDAFSEAIRAQNRLLGYGSDIRYRKRPPTVRDAFSKARNSRLHRLWTASCRSERIFMMRAENLGNPTLIVKGMTQPDFPWLPYSGIASSTKRTLGFHWLCRVSR